MNNRCRPFIVNLNIGTTVKGAIDDLDLVLAIFKKHRIENHYIHCDAALSGAMLPFLENAPKIDFEKPVDSVAISAKFIGSPMPCGVVMTRKKWVKKVETDIEYIGSNDTMILGSRSGHAPLILWYALKTCGAEGLVAEAKACVENARYLFGGICLIVSKPRVIPAF